VRLDHIIKNPKGFSLRVFSLITDIIKTGAFYLHSSIVAAENNSFTTLKLAA
jgi:hypothetical protein